MLGGCIAEGTLKPGPRPREIVEGFFCSEGFRHADDKRCGGIEAGQGPIKVERIDIGAEPEVDARRGQVFEGVCIGRRGGGTGATFTVRKISSGIGVAAFFCFMFSWVELLIARTLTTTDAKPISAIMTRTVGASGVDWGVLAAAGVLTIIPGALVIYFVRNYIAKGFALGRV